MFRILLIFCFISLIAKAQNEGNLLFNTSGIHDVHLNFSQAGYWDSLTQNYTLDKYMVGQLVIDGSTLDSVGVKFKGNSSYNNPSDKKSFKVDLNEFVSGQKYDGIKKFNLNNMFKDPSFLREKVFLDFLKNKNIHAPRSTYARVYINGAYWGLYTLIEEINKKFLDQHFIYDTGNLFKGDPQGDLKWMGNADSLYYSKYSLHTNEVVNDWSDLVDLINSINNSGAASFDSISKRFELNEYVLSWAASNLFVNLDSYVGSGHNYYIYHSPADNKFHWISWDVNEAFGNFQMNMSLTQLQNLSMFFIPAPQSNKPLHQKILSNATMRSMYVNAMCSIVYSTDTAAIFSAIDSLVDVIRTDVYADTKKSFSNQQFDQSINQNISAPGTPGAPVIAGLKPFLRARFNYLKNELNSNGCITSVENLLPDDQAVFPNPCEKFIQVKADANATILINDLEGRRVLFNRLDNNVIDVGSFPSGVYLLKVIGESYSSFHKIVVSH